MLIALFFIGVVTSMFIGTLIEYWFHRAMHANLIMGKTHLNHHRENEVDNWVTDVIYVYFPRLIPVLFLPFFICFYDFNLIWLCIGWLLGGCIYVTIFSYCHKLHHDNPKVLWWLSKNMHYMHHEVDIRYNFGVVVDWWDKVFGTYRDIGPFRNAE